MATDLSALQAVAKETTVTQSTIAVMQSLSAQISDNKNDPAALQTLADSISSSADSLAAAVAANTPAAPATPPPA